MKWLEIAVIMIGGLSWCFGASLVVWSWSAENPRLDYTWWGPIAASFLITLICIVIGMRKL